LPEQTEEQQISHYANLILHSFKDKFHITDTMDVYVTISMGISLYPKHGKDEDSLIKSANRAMYASKRFEKNAYRIYDSELERVHKKSRQIENALKEVNMDEEFEVHFQPKMDIKTNEIRGFEALVRWNHPELGNIPPNEFIKIAEETGNIWKIDEWVLREACKTVQTWNRRRKGKPFYIGVNISANHFAHPDFLPHVQSVLEKTGLDANLLEIEITETTLITNPEETKNNIQRLREIGVTVSIDDFGTGYTSLNYIRNYTFDTIKIDRSYIREMIEKKEDWIIVKTIINLAHELKIKVVAEGVEDEQVLQVLKELNCDEIQGYLISKPLSKGNLENSLNVWRKNNKCSKKQKRGS